MTLTNELYIIDVELLTREELDEWSIKNKIKSTGMPATPYKSLDENGVFDLIHSKTVKENDVVIIGDRDPDVGFLFMLIKSIKEILDEKN